MAFITLPRQLTVDINGEPRVGALLSVYDAGTNNTRTAYTGKDLAVELTQPIATVEGGLFPAAYVAPTGGDYKLVIQDADSSVIYTEDNIPAGVGVSDIDLPAFVEESTNTALIASYARTAAETAAGITPTDYSYPPVDIYVTRYGIVPNDASKRTSNTAALQSLVDPTKNGPRGRLIFPPLTGADTYYFNGMIQVRDGIWIDLCGCTLDFAKSYSASDNLLGFFTFIRDVRIENGTINVNYDGTGGTNAGSVMRIGSRMGYPFGGFPTGEEEDLTTPMGNIELRKLRLVTNNPAVSMILMLGGLRGVQIANVTFNGGGEANEALQYEFGDWHYEATVANRKTTHASGLDFRNITITNLDASVSGAGAVDITGAAECLIENISVDTANQAFTFRPGEALYYNPGTPDVGLVKRCITIRNIRAKNVVTGMQLKAAESKTSGYLSGEALTDAQQRDLMRFSIDGGIISASGQGIYVMGPCDIRNMTLNGGASSGQLRIGDDCIRGVFTNIEVRNSSSIGVSANVGDTISGMTARLKTLTFNECMVSGNSGGGYVIGNTRSVRINGGRIGYQSAIDGQNEDPSTGQNIGVSVDQTSNGGGVYCYGVDVATRGGSAYSITGSITNPCGVYNPKGLITFTGNWDIDGTGRENATNIADKTVYPNTAGKYAGRRVQDTSNNRLMIARGPVATDPWDRADGGAAVTPA